MKTFIQITFFIFISFALHLLLLPFDFMSSAVSHDSGRVGITYISTSPDNFYPQPVPPQISQALTSPLQQAQPATSIVPEQPQASALPTVKEFKPVDLVVEMMHEDVSPESVVIKVVDPLSDEPTDKVVPVESSPDNAVAMEATLSVEKQPEFSPSDPLPELTSQPLVQSSLEVEPSVGEEFSPSAIIATQGEVSASNQAQGSTLSDQKNNNLSQGFKDALPRYDINPPPRYPDVAKLRGWEGKVVFEALILQSGRVGRLNIMASSGYRSLDNAARKAISRWKFSPATTFGKPIDSEVEIPVTFSLRDL